jgi:hypothetical protein
MKKIVFGIYLSVASTLVWSQPTISVPSLPPPPPPPNPASFSGFGSPGFDMLFNNIKSTQSSEPMKDSLIQKSIEEGLISGSGNAKGKKPSTAYDSQPRGLQTPESFESNIQGLQFIEKTPLK